jgi:hypothetical protein
MELIIPKFDSAYYSIYKASEDEAWEVLHGIFDDVSEKFDRIPDFTLNWLFLSTSGIHGTYTTLDILRNERLYPDELDPADYDYEEPCTLVTFLIVSPRICRIIYGNVMVSTEEEDQWLRDKVQKTLEGIKTSQEGNYQTK